MDQHNASNDFIFPKFLFFFSSQHFLAGMVSRPSLDESTVFFKKAELTCMLQKKSYLFRLIKGNVGKIQKKQIE